MYMNEPNQTPDLDPANTTNDTPNDIASSSPPQFDPAEVPVAVVSHHKTTSKLKKILLVVSGVVVLAAILAAAAYYATQQDKTEEAAVSAKKDIPLLRIGMMAEDINMAYPEAPIESVGAVEISNQLFESLVRYEDLTKVKPNLATGWSNPDSSTWVFNLKQGVKFHTGRTMTAEDVKYSIEALQKQDSSTAETYASTIKSVEVINDYKVKITTDGPDPILLNKLTYIYVFDSKSATPNDPVNGSGPYVVKPNTTPAADKLELVAFDAYHGGHVFTRALSFSVIDEDQILDDLKNGKLDIAGDFSKKQLQILPPSAKTMIDDGASVSTLGMRTSRPGPMQNIKFRQALTYLVDKPAIVKAAGVDAVPADQLIPEQIPGYDPSLVPVTRNVAKAKELLSGAGYPNGATLKIVHSTYFTAYDELARQLAEGGITLQPHATDNIDELYEDIEGDKTDLYITGYSSSFADGSDFLSEYGQALANYTGSDFDQILDDASKEFNASLRLNLLQKASSVLADDAVVIPLYQREYYNGISKKSYQVKQEISGTSRGIYYYKVYEQ